MASQINILLQQEPNAFVTMMIGKRWLPHNGQVLGDRHLYNPKSAKDQPPPLYIDGADQDFNLHKIHDVRAIILELDLLVTRAKQAATSGKHLALQGYTKILAEALALDDVGILGRVMHSQEGLVQDLVDLFHIVVVAPSTGATASECAQAGDVGVRSAVATEVIETFNLIADCVSVPEVKDTFGKLLLPDLALVMRRTIVEAHPDFGIGSIPFQRALLSLTVNFLKKSKPNKDIFLTSCDVVGQVLMEMSDCVVQMQCVEILYRLLKHKKLVLRRPSFQKNSRVPIEIVTGIEHLPNDHTLLRSITTLLEDMNTASSKKQLEAGTSGAVRSVLTYDVEGVDVAKRSLITQPTKIYFHVSHLVVLYPNCTGEHVAIPYGEIRSVRLSKDRKIVFCLYRIRRKLMEQLFAALENKSLAAASSVSAADVVTYLESEPTFAIHLNPAALVQLRNSPVHGWIHDWKLKLQEKAQRDEMNAMLAEGGRLQSHRAATAAPASQSQSLLHSRPASRPVSHQPSQQQQYHHEEYLPASQQRGPQHLHDVVDQNSPMSGSKRSRQEMEGDDRQQQEYEKNHNNQNTSRNGGATSVSSMRPQPLSMEEQQIMGRHHHHQQQQQPAGQIEGGGGSNHQAVGGSNLHNSRSTGFQQQQLETTVERGTGGSGRINNMSSIHMQSHVESHHNNNGVVGGDEENREEEEGYQQQRDNFRNSNSRGVAGEMRGDTTCSSLYAANMGGSRGPVGAPSADSSYEDDGEDGRDSSGGSGGPTDEQMMNQLRDMLSGNISKHKQNFRTMMDKSMAQIQHQIDLSKNTNRRDRDAYEQFCQTELKEARRQVEEFTVTLHDSIRNLNQGLAEIQEFGCRIEDQIYLLQAQPPEEGEEEGSGDQHQRRYNADLALDNQGRLAQQVEVAELGKIKEKVEGEMSAMQDLLSSYISSVNPLKFLTGYMNKRLASGSSSAGTLLAGRTGGGRSTAK